MPIIIVFCITGAYSLKNSVFDVGQMLVFGVLGYAMKKLGYSPAALTLALVLGPLAERALRQSLIISDSRRRHLLHAADLGGADGRRARRRAGAALRALRRACAARRRREAALTAGAQAPMKLRLPLLHEGGLAFLVVGAGEAGLDRALGGARRRARRRPSAPRRRRAWRSAR